jgi:hypothetical protein
MNSVMEPLFAIFAIFAPLGLAYVILVLQSRRPASKCRKLSEGIKKNLMHKMTKLSREEEKIASR